MGTIALGFPWLIPTRISHGRHHPRISMADPDKDFPWAPSPSDFHGWSRQGFPMGAIALRFRWPLSRKFLPTLRMISVSLCVGPEFVRLWLTSGCDFLLFCMRWCRQGRWCCHFLVLLLAASFNGKSRRRFCLLDCLGIYRHVSDDCLTRGVYCLNLFLELTKTGLDDACGNRLAPALSRPLFLAPQGAAEQTDCAHCALMSRDDSPSGDLAPMNFRLSKTAR